MSKFKNGDRVILQRGSASYNGPPPVRWFRDNGQPIPPPLQVPPNETFVFELLDQGGDSHTFLAVIDWNALPEPFPLADFPHGTVADATPQGMTRVRFDYLIGLGRSPFVIVREADLVLE